MTEIIFNSGVGNDPSFTVLDLSRFESVRSVMIGDESFMYVSEFNITGFSELQSVVIGEKSFTKSNYGNDPNRHFYLNGCPKLKSLRMGGYSFSDYTVIEIENVDALEVIEMGGDSFQYASLELKSILIQSE